MKYFWRKIFILELFIYSWCPSPFSYTRKVQYLFFHLTSGIDNNYEYISGIFTNQTKRYNRPSFPMSLASHIHDRKKSLWEHPRLASEFLSEIFFFNLMQLRLPFSLTPLLLTSKGFYRGNHSSFISSLHFFDIPNNLHQISKRANTLTCNDFI